MHKRLLKTLIAVVAMTGTGICAAQDADKEEAARQQAFRSGMEAIVADLNNTWYTSFINAIDQEDMLDRIFGLRLIDPNVKKGFLDQLEWTWNDLISSQFRPTDDGVKATLLGVESRGNRGRAVVRFDLPKQQFNYHEYDLLLDENGRVVIVDWIDYLDGMQFSQNIGEWLVAAMPKSPALRKLVDFRNTAENDLFQFGELLKAARDGRLPRFMEIHDRLPERYQQQRIVLLARVHLARQVRKRRDMLAGLESLAQYYPQDPLYSLLLLDHYFPRRKYQEATETLLRLQRRLGFDDAAMEARLSAAALVMGNTEDAAGHAKRAIELEQDLELAWWSALDVRATQEDYAASVEALEKLEEDFGYELRPKLLGRFKKYEGLLASEEYQAWNAGKDSSAEKW